MRYFSQQSEANGSDTRCVAVVYESSVLRDRAVGFCERLAEGQKFSMVEINWWSFPLLAQPLAGADAAQKAASADVMVFAMEARGDLPNEIKFWVERWLNKRGEREGALIALLNHEERPYCVATFREIYLRHAARRAGMDYLSHSAPTAARAIPDSLDSYSERADQMTSVLDTILHAQLQNPPLLYPPGL
ncbi:MAG TPA: hypothetical protein VN873_17085 [Candidatus Angelobacter sp.]|nr:hypothetical protein [Candidatus Angelobacter sp.]